MREAIVKIFYDKEYLLEYSGFLEIGSLVVNEGNGRLRRANCDEWAIGVVIRVDVPWGCLDIFDEVVV